MTITARPRPFTLTFLNSNNVYPLTSVEAQRLLDEYVAVRATSNMVELQGHNSNCAFDRTILRPATRGGGPAFDIAHDA